MQKSDLANEFKTSTYNLEPKSIIKNFPIILGTVSLIFLTTKKKYASNFYFSSMTHNYCMVKFISLGKGYSSNMGSFVKR